MQPTTTTIPVSYICEKCGSDREYFINWKKVRECSCDFWEEKVLIKDELTTARINGEHYIIGSRTVESNNGKRQGLGMGGTPVTIAFFDGRVENTVDLWHQGTIPAGWRNELPDNAVFVRGEK